MNNRLTGTIAFRYLRGKGAANAVPILSRISMVAIAVSSAAMIVVFSVFNGLEDVVKSIYTDFYPDIKISAARGKFFEMNAARLAAVGKIAGVANVCKVIEDNVFANNLDQQKVIVIKGIENDYFKVNRVQRYIVQGDSTVTAGSPNTAIMGMHIVNELGVDVNTPSYITVYYPNPDITNPADNPLEAFQTLKLHPGGVFHVQEDFDNKYVLAPLSLVQYLFHRPGSYSSIEISTAPGMEAQVRESLRALLGPAFTVETRYEQNRTLYMVMGTEKWAIYVILVLVLLIASFNMIGALSMLILEKQKDIAILKAMGAFPATLRRIFLYEGLLWSAIGGVSGLLLGAAICYAQLRFSLLKMGGSFLVDAFPVKMIATDFLLVIVTIFGVGLLASIYPSRRAVAAEDPALKSA